jgi:hypothetical protein
MMFLLRLILAAEALFLGERAIRSTAWERRVPTSDSRETEGEVFGIGIGRDSGTIFWFHGGSSEEKP